MPRRSVERALLIGIAVGILAIAGSSVVGPPVGLGHVEADGMAPTMQPGDGYVAVPAGDVERGDVVVFWSAVDDDYVVRRVVGERAGGYVTRGDANARTDQAAGHPPVPRSAVVATVLAAGGSPVAVPGLGVLVRTLQQHPLLVLGLLGLLAVGSVIRRRAGRRARRGNTTVLRVGDVVGPILLIGFLFAAALTPLGAANYQLTYAASPDPSGGYSIPIDEPATRTVSIDAVESPLIRYVVRAEGTTIVDRTAAADTIDLTVSIPARGVAGPRPTTVRAYPYLDVLPVPLLERLHDVHPLVAIAGTSGALFGGVSLLYRLLMDGDRPVLRTRSDWAKFLEGS